MRVDPSPLAVGVGNSSRTDPACLSQESATLVSDLGPLLDYETNEFARIMQAMRNHQYNEHYSDVEFSRSVSHFAHPRLRQDLSLLWVPAGTTYWSRSCELHLGFLELETIEERREAERDEGLPNFTMGQAWI